METEGERARDEEEGGGRACGIGGGGITEKMEIRKQTSGEDERGQCGSCWRPSVKCER